MSYEKIIKIWRSFSCWNFSGFLLKIFLLFLPFQIRTLIFNMPYLYTGNFSEYSTYFIYFSDILLVGAFIFFALSFWKEGEESERKFEFGYLPLTICLFVFYLTLFASVFFAEIKILHFFYVFRFLEFSLLYFLIVNRVLKRMEVLKYFLFGMIVQSVIALGQYIRQSSMGLEFLGEPNINASMQGVAKVDLEGTKILRSYGTFPHPNLFAGTIVFAILSAFYIYRKKLLPFFVIMAILLMALLFTFSRSAFLALVGGALILFSLSEKKIKFNQVVLLGSIFVLLIVIFNLEGAFFERFVFGDDPNSGVERLQYLRASRDMLFKYPFGVGFGHFTLHLQEFVGAKLSPWLMQPVHNVYLLAVNEIGVFGGGMYAILNGLVYYWLLRALKFVKGNNRTFVFVLLSILTSMIIINLFDHYLFTLYQGQAMFFLYLSLASSVLNKALLPRKKS